MKESLAFLKNCFPNGIPIIVMHHYTSCQKQIENLESEQAATVREKQELQKKQKTLSCHCI